MPWSKARRRECARLPRSIIGAPARGEMYCGSDASISRAAAEICHRPVDVLVGRMRVHAQEVCRSHCCPVDGGYDFNITLQDKGFRCVYFGGTLNSI